MTDSPYVCDHCGKIYTSRRGLEIHSASAHDDYIGQETRTCDRDGCQEEFTVNRSDPQKYCSHDCSIKAGASGRSKYNLSQLDPEDLGLSPTDDRTPEGVS